MTPTKASFWPRPSPNRRGVRSSPAKVLNDIRRSKKVNFSDVIDLGRPAAPDKQVSPIRLKDFKLHQFVYRTPSQSFCAKQSTENKNPKMSSTDDDEGVEETENSVPSKGPRKGTYFDSEEFQRQLLTDYDSSTTEYDTEFMSVASDNGGDFGDKRKSTDSGSENSSTSGQTAPLPTTTSVGLFAPITVETGRGDDASSLPKQTCGEKTPQKRPGIFQTCVERANAKNTPILESDITSQLYKKIQADMGDFSQLDVNSQLMNKMYEMFTEDKRMHFHAGHGDSLTPHSEMNILTVACFLDDICERVNSELVYEKELSAIKQTLGKHAPTPTMNANTPSDTPSYSTVQSGSRNAAENGTVSSSSTVWSSCASSIRASTPNFNRPTGCGDVKGAENRGQVKIRFSPVGCGAKRSSSPMKSTTNLTVRSGPKRSSSSVKSTTALAMGSGPKRSLSSVKSATERRSCVKMLSSPNTPSRVSIKLSAKVCPESNAAKKLDTSSSKVSYEKPKEQQQQQEKKKILTLGSSKAETISSLTNPSSENFGKPVRKRPLGHKPNFPPVKVRYRRHSRTDAISEEYFRVFHSLSKTNDPLKTGVVITKTMGINWLKDAGILDPKLTADKVGELFSKDAGLRLVLNSHDFYHFLKKISRLKNVRIHQLVNQMIKCRPIITRAREVPSIAAMMSKHSSSAQSFITALNQSYESPESSEEDDAIRSLRRRIYNQRYWKPRRR